MTLAVRIGYQRFRKTLPNTSLFCFLNRGAREVSELVCLCPWMRVVPPSASVPSPEDEDADVSPCADFNCCFATSCPFRDRGAALALRVRFCDVKLLAMRLAKLLSSSSESESSSKTETGTGRGLGTSGIVGVDGFVCA